MKKYDLIYVFCCTLFKQQDFPVAAECVLIVTCFCVVQTWQARRVWKVIYSFQKSQNKTWMTVFFRRKEVCSVYLVTYSEANMETYPVTWKLLLRS